jgi:hypothetical protein
MPLMEEQRRDHGDPGGSQNDSCPDLMCGEHAAFRRMKRGSDLFSVNAVRSEFRVTFSRDANSAALRNIQ